MQIERSLQKEGGCYRNNLLGMDKLDFVADREAISLWLREFIKKRRESNLLKLQLRSEQDIAVAEREVEYMYPYVIKWIDRQTMGVLTKKSISKKDLRRLFPNASEEAQDAIWHKLLKEKKIYRANDLPRFYIVPRSGYDNNSDRSG
jgi:hypothetical protein